MRLCIRSRNTCRSASAQCNFAVRSYAAVCTDVSEGSDLRLSHLIEARRLSSVHQSVSICGLCFDASVQGDQIFKHGNRIVVVAINRRCDVRVERLCYRPISASIDDYPARRFVLSFHYQSLSWLALAGVSAAGLARLAEGFPEYPIAADERGHAAIVMVREAHPVSIRTLPDALDIEVEHDFRLPVFRSRH